MTPQSTADQIQKLIAQLPEAKKAIRERGLTAASAEAEYQLEKASTAIGLKNGKEYSLDDDTIIKPPVTLIPLILKGLCWHTLLKRDESEALYKSAILNLRALETAISGLQSINRYVA